jgi:hypothetical protein
MFYTDWPAIIVGHIATMLAVSASDIFKYTGGMASMGFTWATDKSGQSQYYVLQV